MHLRHDVRREALSHPSRRASVSSKEHSAQAMIAVRTTNTSTTRSPSSAKCFSTWILIGGGWDHWVARTSASMILVHDWELNALCKTWSRPAEHPQNAFNQDLMILLLRAVAGQHGLGLFS